MLKIDTASNGIGGLVIGGDFQGLGILRSLSRKGIPTCLLDSEICIGRFSRHKGRYFGFYDKENEEAFLLFLESLADKAGLEGWVVYPTTDEIVHFLSKHKKRLEKHLSIATPAWEVTKYFYNKQLTYKLASDLGIAIPMTWYPESQKEVQELEITFPVIIKPAIKDHFFPKIKKKVLLVNNRAELINAYARANTIIDASEIMIQEVIPGSPNNLYSFCSLFKNGDVLARLTARRARQHPMDFGNASTFVQTVDLPELEKLGTKLLKAVAYYGLSEVEFKYDQRDSKFKLLEVNPRTWGWHSIGAGAGVDFPYLLFSDLIGAKFETNGFEKDIKWIRSITDVPIVVSEVLRGKMTITDYFRSMSGKKELAVFSWDDPMPFLVELFLAPLLWKKRGF